MKMRFVLVTIALFFASGSIAAGEEIKPARISSGEYTTESVAPELAKIVVLCAEEEEKKFEKEWQ